MEKALRVINQMQKEGVFKNYAIGGGIAAVFYIEPITTFDLDIFIEIESKSDILLLSPVYEWLKKRGYKSKGESIIIEGIAVQFIPVYNELVKEAVGQAVTKIYRKIKTKILSKEYLIALMVQTGRPKDKERISLFINQGGIRDDILQNILTRHDLVNTWNRLKNE